MKLSIYVTLFMTLLIAGAGDGLARDIGHLHSLALEPQSGTLLMGTHQGLYESRDDGKSWTVGACVSGSNRPRSAPIL